MVRAAGETAWTLALPVFLQPDFSPICVGVSTCCLSIRERLPGNPENSLNLPSHVAIFLITTACVTWQSSYSCLKRSFVACLYLSFKESWDEMGQILLRDCLSEGRFWFWVGINPSIKNQITPAVLSTGGFFITFGVTCCVKWHDRSARYGFTPLKREGTEETRNLYKL